MASGIKNQTDQSLSKEVETESTGMNTPASQTIDPQVKVRKVYSPRRSFDTAYKLRILSAYNNCENSSERGTLLRKEGLYHSRIIAWKQQLENSKLNGKKQIRDTLRSDHLSRENEQLKKKLAHAEAIIDLQKKISDLLGTHILPHEKSESKS
ncbi:MAG: hypothetical protein ACYCQI_10265 [Gammaproteobacteria bacterium]